ncbi:MAG: aldehyde dehydrogenase family protein, partial [Nocardioidaceae bacterium]|nr:aldehyde dehydrogenase family protein [Nocardioidaceae bacterium]
MARIEVRKTYKLYIGGAFPRSESGHSYEVADTKGRFVANAALASRKDVRDAVLAARKAFGGWSARTAYNRSQILYRIAEVMEDRRPQFEEALKLSEGATAAVARKQVDESVDRLVWYAGWADKLGQVIGNANPVAGPFFNHTAPEPTGVVGVLAPQRSSLLGLVSVIAPVITTGN